MPLLIRLLTTALWSLALLTFQSSEFIKPLTPKSPPVIEQKTDWSKEELSKPPNIIIVLSEAFWDITQMTNLKFSEDPAPFFHALQERYTHGTMLSPMFGGGTANVELEVLTGHSYRFFQEGSIVYEQYIKQPTASLATILSSQGYKATAISPFYNWYFNSSEVYKHLGFSKFISLEYFNPDEYVGPYIGDHAVAKRIIEESEKNPGPDFIFANTMENHYHYWPGKFKRNTIDVSGTGSNEALGIAETYAQGMRGADDMLQELVTHFSQVKEPTVLVFFGDHLPSLEQYLVYKESKYITGEDDPDFLEKMHSTPVIVWNNYLPPGQTDELHISPSFLSPYILHLAGRKGSAYTDYLSELSKKMPIVPPEDHYEAYHIDVDLVKEYEARQNAILEAEKNNALASDPPFTLGYGDPVVKQITPEAVTVRGDTFGKAQLTLRGGRFGLGSTVFVNGQQLQSQWQSEETLTVSLPKELYAKPGRLDVQVKTIDSKNHVLGQSQVLTVPVVEKTAAP
ncbi:LTA synthase family protein [Paenibacillus cremeus]|uniref:LTA synthase family protein n=1 Tax=Paenibacillus cremeus TaxID=2163881 RepID=A0A559K669_9BACL|nr:LTA synthase family protein [Paenibacillus cremeus]TVY07629.1 LTA synthase family protein [Paenibacillus cremeus]